MSHRHFIMTVGVVAALVLLVLTSTWVRFGMRFTRPCRVFPQSEWILQKTEPDTFEARLLERGKGDRQQIDLYRFERGDLVRFGMAPDLTPGLIVPAGSEMAWFDSHETRSALEELRPQLLEAEANLRAASTGERDELVALARSEVDAARAEHDRLSTEYERAQQLLEQGLVSNEAFDLAKALERTAEADLQAAQLRLEVAQVGEKEAVIAGWRAHRDWLKQRIDIAAERLEENRVRCPIQGEIVTLQGDSALVRVAAMDTLYAIAPVSPSRAQTLAAGQTAIVKTDGMGSRRFEGWVSRVDRQVSSVHQQSVVWVTVAIPNPGRASVAGMKGNVEFRGEKITLLAWLTDRLRHTMDHTLGV